MFHRWAETVYSLGGCLDLEVLFAPQHLIETTVYVLHGFIWLGVCINSFIVSIMWTTFAINKQALIQGSDTNPQVWMNLENVPASACCLKTYAPIYFVVVTFLFVAIVGHHLYADHSGHNSLSQHKKEESKRKVEDETQP